MRRALKGLVALAVGAALLAGTGSAAVAEDQGGGSRGGEEAGR